jgi:tetratricopeptide (TPR) repeat protein
MESRWKCRAMARRGWEVWVAAAAAALVGVLAFTPPASAQSTLSERLARTIALGQKNDLQRQFGRLLVDRDRSFDIDPAASVDETRATLARRASVYETVKEFDKAEAELTSALQLDAPAAGLYVDRGYFYMRRNRFADALADFLAGARLDPGNARLRFAAGRAQAAMGNYPAALGFYNEAIKLRARDPRFYLARAEALIHLEDPRRAWDDYDHAIDIKLSGVDDRYFALLGRGYASLMLSDYRSAIADFGGALQVDPRAVTALLWRGYARELDGETELALDDYEHASEVDPKDRWARANVQRLRSN